MDVLRAFGVKCVVDEKGSRPAENHYVVRSGVSDVTECDLFVKEFGEMTDTKWKVDKTNRNKDSAR